MTGQATPRDSIAQHPLAPPFVVAVVALLAGLLVITPWMVGSMYDDGTYMVLAKSLASGMGYRYLNLPGAPDATHFPPGYPAFLAIFLRLAPDFQAGVAATKLANAALLPCVALGVYALCRRAIGWRAWPSALVALVGVTAPALLSMNAALMSETLFLAVLFPVLVLSERLVRRESTVWAALAVGALIGVLQLIRSIGLPVLGAVMLVLLIRRRWRDMALVLAAAVVVVAPWMAWVAVHAGQVPPALAANYGSYRDWIQQSTGVRALPFLFQVARHNVPVHAMYLGDRFMPFDGALPSKVAFGCILLAWAAGVAALRRSVPVTLLFLAGYIALVVTWPYAPDRFYYPLEPLMAVLIAAGATVGWRWWREGRAAGGAPRRALAVVMAAAVAVLCAGYVRENTESLHARRWERHQRLVHFAMLPVVTWVRDKTPRAAIVGTDVDPLVYLYADRRTMPLVNFRAEYYLREDPYGSPERVHDTRDLLAAFRPGYAVLRAGAAPVRDAVMATLPRLAVSATAVDTLPHGGAVLELRWTDPRPAH